MCAYGLTYGSKVFEIDVYTGFKNKAKNKLPSEPLESALPWSIRRENNNTERKQIRTRSHLRAGSMWTVVIFRLRIRFTSLKTFSLGAHSVKNKISSAREDVVDKKHVTVSGNRKKVDARSFWAFSRVSLPVRVYV